MLVLYKKNPFDGLLLSLIIRLIKIYEKLGLDLDYWNIQNTLFEIKENIKNIKISSKEDALLYLNDDMKNNLVFLFDFFKINPDL